MDIWSSGEIPLSLQGVCKLMRENNKQDQEILLQYILLKTGGVNTCSEVYSDKAIIIELLNIASNNNDSLGQLALNSIINITGSEEGAIAVLKAGDLESDILYKILNFILEPYSSLADHGCKILANMTISQQLATIISMTIVREDITLTKIVDIVRNSKIYNKKGYRLEYLTQFLGNLSQSADFQTYILHEDNDKMPSLLPILYLGDSSLERRGIASLIYNCLFDSNNHSVLLHEPFNILPVLLLPLAGPEEFDDSEYDQMPLELQYLSKDKTREEDSDIRKILLKSLLLLCATKFGRTFLRDHQTYLILREYHKWEEDRNNLLACENVIDILIRTEEEIGVDDLRSLQVPDDLHDKFEQMDLSYVNNT